MTAADVIALHARLEEIERERAALAAERARIKHRLLVANTAALERLNERMAEQEERARAADRAARANIDAEIARRRNRPENPVPFQEAHEERQERTA